MAHQCQPRPFYSQAQKQSKCFSFFFFFFTRASSNLRDSFMMVFTQNSRIFHWALHQPIVFFQVWSHTRQFEPLTEELWLSLWRHFFLHVYKSLSFLKTSMGHSSWEGSERNKDYSEPFLGSMPSSACSVNLVPTSTTCFDHACEQHLKQLWDLCGDLLVNTFSEGEADCFFFHLFKVGKL